MRQRDEQRRGGEAQISVWYTLVSEEKEAYRTEATQGCSRAYGTFINIEHLLTSQRMGVVTKQYNHNSVVQAYTGLISVI